MPGSPAGALPLLVLEYSIGYPLRATRLLTQIIADPNNPSQGPKARIIKNNSFRPRMTAFEVTHVQVTPVQGTPSVDVNEQIALTLALKLGYLT